MTVANYNTSSTQINNDTRFSNTQYEDEKYCEQKRVQQESKRTTNNGGKIEERERDTIGFTKSEPVVESMRAACQQLLTAGRTTSRWRASSAGHSSCDTIALRGRRVVSFSYENRTIATMAAASMEPFTSTTTTSITTRRRQRPTAISILPSICCSPSFVGIRTHSSTSNSTSSNNNNGGESNTERKNIINPVLSSSSSSSIIRDNNNADDDSNTNITKATAGSANATTTSATTSDPSIVTWVDDYLPPSARPYAHLSRMDKPIGTWLLLWPCYWSTAMAAGVIPQGGSNATTAVIVAPPTTLLEVLPDPKLLGLFTVGAFVMRGAGCTINDMWDRDLDNQVARTKTRPLAAGILTPTQAVGWLAVQLSAGLGVLVSLPHTEYCFWWGAASLPLVVAYPLMKRFFDYPQLVLGVCFNWGAFMGWAAVHGGMDYNVVLPLYASGVAWTIGYDTLYAHQDKEDDAKLGLKSTAITFGKFGSSSSNGENGDDDDESRHKRVLYGLAATTYACWLLAGYNDFVGTIAPTTTMTGQLLPFGGVGAYALGVTGAYAHLVWQIRTADLNDPHNLAERFRSNAKVGGIVFGSILAGKMAMLA